MPSHFIVSNEMQALMTRTSPTPRPLHKRSGCTRVTKR